MASVMPKTEQEMLQIQGVGEAKFRTFGRVFLNRIINFVPEVPTLNLKSKNDTYKETLTYYLQGMSLEEIAMAKKVKVDTVVTHLIKLNKEGAKINFDRLIEEETIGKVKQTIESIDYENKLSPIYEHLNQDIPYYKIKIALELLNK
jgi:ATP-dependent DNA helicase RecQ